MPDPKLIQSVVFDVFGTVVDWHGTIIREGRAITRKVDWAKVAYDWLIGYRSRVEQVRKGERPWSNLDVLLQEAFDELAPKYKLDELDGHKIKHFRRVWHRLRPWPDTRPGLGRIRKPFVVGALSNGNVLL